MVRGRGGQRDEQVPSPAANESRNQRQWDRRSEGEVQRGGRAGRSPALQMRRRRQPGKAPWLPKGGRRCVLRRCLGVDTADSPPWTREKTPAGIQTRDARAEREQFGQTQVGHEGIDWVGKADKAWGWRWGRVGQNMGGKEAAGLASEVQV